MFCYECEQTMRTESGAGCTVKGVCGKDEATADLQDILVYQLKGIAQYRIRMAELGVAEPEADSFVLSALFSTLTNFNFNRPPRCCTYSWSGSASLRSLRRRRTLRRH